MSTDTDEHVATIPSRAREGHRRAQGGYQQRFVIVYFLDAPPLTPCIAEQWDTKGKFPPNLKPLLVQVALKAIVLGEYDDNFFNLMPRIFPYNRFTMFVSTCFLSRRFGAEMIWLETHQADGVASTYRLAARTPERARGGAAQTV